MKKSSETLSFNNKKIWYFLGVFLNCGILKKDNKIILKLDKFTEKEIQKISEFMNSFEHDDFNSFLGNFSIKTKKIIIRSESFHMIFNDFIKIDSNKSIPEWVQNTPIPYVKEFLNGVFITDNLVTLEYNNDSLEFFLSIQRLYLKIGEIKGIECKFSKDIKMDCKKSCKIYEIYDIQGDILKKNLGFIENDFLWVPIIID